MTRPRRRVSDAAASRNHPPASLAPPLWARGWCGPVLPLAPSRRRRVIVRDLHHGHPIATAGAGTGGTVSTVVGVVLTAATVAASCREPAATSVSRGSPDAATTLPTAAARGALDECCLMGTDAPNLSTLAGASSGTVGATLRTKTQDQAPAPRNRGCLGGTLPTTNSRGPVSSSARARLWPPRRLSPPLLRSLTPGVSAVRAASSIDRPVAGISAPAAGACSSAASTALGDGGGGFHLSGGSSPPIALFLLLLSRRRGILWGRRGREPLLLAQPVLLALMLPALPPPDPPLLPTRVLTPKIGIGKGLTCGPSLVKKRHSAGKSPQRIR
jgi:hypothetical protein